MATEMVATWKGRPATELTREELLKAFTHAVKMLAEERQIHQIDLEILGAGRVRVD
jgi:hypothetical protein